MEEIGERVAVVETEVTNLRRTTEGIDEKLDQLLDEHTRRSAYERLGKQVYDVLKIVVAAVAGAWAAASFPWFHR